MQKIVVGVEGSDGSLEALKWAMGEARLRGAEIVALHAWTYPVVTGTFEAVVPADIKVDFAAESKELLDRTIKTITGGNGGVTVRPEVVQKPAAQALIEASRDADLLVIGSRGLGGFRGLLLGSVGQQCAHHASCPVVIIPHADRANA
jgi:nucleotide-binding universal stress UspA family protein